MEISLFDEIDNQIESIENVGGEKDVLVFKVKMKNGNEFFMPYDLNLDLKDIVDSLFENMKFEFPQDSEGIRKFCEYIITSMTYYYNLKVYKRLNYSSNGVSNNINELLQIAEKSLKKRIECAATLSPLWFGRKVKGLPVYNGDNPYNIIGVDHKYDYLLKDDEKYFSKRRDLILSIAISSKPVVISEQQLIECTALINAVNNAKLPNNVSTKKN